MGISYRLTLAGNIPLDQLAELAAPDAIDPSRTAAGCHLLSFNLYEERGYWLSIRSGRNGYYDAEDDGDHY